MSAYARRSLTCCCRTFWAVSYDMDATAAASGLVAMRYTAATPQAVPKASAKRKRMLQS